MFTIIDEIAEKINNLTLDRVVEDVFAQSDVSRAVEDLQLDQYRKGQTALGEDTIYGLYAEESPKYPRVTQITAGEKIEFLDTGDFYRSIVAEASKDEIVLDAKDWKKEILEDIYGADSVVGLHETSKESLAGFVLHNEYAQHSILRQLI